jgi:fumarylpyruvate hydrolase
VRLPPFSTSRFHFLSFPTEVNGNTIRENARRSDLVWSVPEIASDLSRFHHLAPGDLFFSGTPAGVGAVVSGDRILGEIDGLEAVSLKIE